MSTDIRPNKAQLSKIIQAGGFLGNMIGKLGKDALMNLAVALAKDVFLKLGTKATWSILDKLERKIRGRGAVRAGKGFIYFE